MTSDFITSGTLKEFPFVEIAGEIHQLQLTGSLHLLNYQAERKTERIIYFADGEVYAAASNLAVDSALAILIRAGRVTPEMAGRIQREVTSGRSFSEALVSYRCVTAEELNQLRIEHVKSIFNSLCEWTEGSFQFTEGDQVPGGTLGVNTKVVILEGALFSRVPNDFQELASDPCTWISAGQTITGDIQLPPFSSFLVSCLNQPRNLVIMSESGRMDESDYEILQQLYAVYCAGIVQFVKAAANPLLKVREKATTPTIDAIPAAAAEAEPPKIITALARPLHEDPESVKRRRLEEIKRGIKQIRQTLTMANDDYAILGLKAGATVAEVKHSYRQMVNYYHPDRHHHHADSITLATLSEILMAIRSAYETAIEHALLTEIIASNTKRYQTTQSYRTNIIPIVYQPAETTGENGKVEKIEAEKMTAEAIKSRNASVATLKHRQAVSCQTRGEYDQAISLMNDAVTLAPDVARYHGDLASLLEKVPMRREQVEHHLIRATELEPGNIFYHLQLGSFYRTVGLFSRAEQQFILALKIDPIDRAAANALEEVVSLRKKQMAGHTYGRQSAARKQNFWTRIFGRGVR